MLGDAMQHVYRIPDLAYYAAHSHNNWMVKRLTEQHMEAVSRASRRLKSKAKGRNWHDMHQGTFIQSLSGEGLRRSRGAEGGSDMNLQSRNETREGQSSFVKKRAEGQRTSSEQFLDTNAMGVTTPTFSPPKKDFLPFRTSEPVGDKAASQELPSKMKIGDANQNDVKGPEGEQEVIRDIRKGLSVLGGSNNIPTSVLRYDEYPVRDTSKLSIVRNSEEKKRNYMEENDADEDEVELLGKSNSSDSSKRLSREVTKESPNSGAYLTFDEVRKNRSRIIQRRKSHNRGYENRDLTSQQISSSPKPVLNNRSLTEKPKNDIGSSPVVMPVHNRDMEGHDDEIDSIDEQIQILLAKRQKLEKRG
ncbi:hypothetical protein FGB62_9g014 [Gracilaria domingensis]|nr:hypothetical protein FGB62_9g014 [Gracilaria domingensis]